MRFLTTIGLMCLLASPISADGPERKHRFNQMGRFFGVGWSDGYHACHYETRPLGSDLPPNPSWLRQRWRYPHAPHGIAGTQHTTGLSVTEGHDVSLSPPDMQPPTSPNRSPVPPAILEEIHRYDRETAPSEIPESLEEQAAYDNFLDTVRHTSSRPMQRADSRFIHEPVDDGSLGAGPLEIEEPTLPSLTLPTPASPGDISIGRLPTTAQLATDRSIREREPAAILRAPLTPAGTDRPTDPD